MFDRKYLKNEIDKLDGVLTDNINLYLIGSGSMSFQNLKDATKDIDVVVRSENDMNLLKSALAQMGYSVPAAQNQHQQNSNKNQENNHMTGISRHIRRWRC